MNRHTSAYSVLADLTARLADLNTRSGDDRMWNRWLWKERDIGWKVNRKVISCF